MDAAANAALAAKIPSPDFPNYVPEVSSDADKRANHRPIFRCKIDISMQAGRSAVIERMRQRNFRLNPFESERSSGSVLKNGEPAASGWTAEQTSCRNPGKVSSAERALPPMVALAS